MSFLKICLWNYSNIRLPFSSCWNTDSIRNTHISSIPMTDSLTLV